MKSGVLRGALAAAFFLLAASSCADAAEKVRIGLTRFTSKVEGVTDVQASIVTDLFSFELSQSKNIALSEREQIKRIGEELKFDMSGLVDPSTAAEIGKVMGVQYMLLGAVTQLDQKASGGGFVVAAGAHEAKATLDMRVVEVSTAEVVLATRAEGTSKNESFAFSYSGFTYAETEFGGLEARAIADAVTRLAYEVRSNIANEYPRIVSTTSDGFAIDVAAAKEGAIYLVFADGGAIFGFDNEILGREKIPIAIIKVTDVGSGYSIAQVAANGGSAKNIQRGDKIEPITAQKAKELAKKLPKERPVVRSAAAESLLADGGAPSFYQSGGARLPNPPKTVTAGADVSAPDSEEETEEPAAPSPKPATPAKKPAARQPEAPAANDGFDPNNSTDSKVIATYPIASREKNMLGIKQRNAYKLYASKRYKEALQMFGELAEEYECNYLSAYWAGMTANKLRDKEQAGQWFDLALSRNPDYQPAAKEKEKLNPSGKGKKKK
jgi:curli biogenesis system outer membrane secretion channel CsgG/TolA-binding protein